MNTTTSVMETKRAAMPTRPRPSLHLTNLVRDTRPNEFVWGKVQENFWRLPRPSFANTKSVHDLGTFDNGIGFSLTWSFRSIRGTMYLIATLTPTEDKGRVQHTNLRIWQKFMTWQQFADVKKEQQFA